MRQAWDLQDNIKTLDIGKEGLSASRRSEPFAWDNMHDDSELGNAMA
jgi:hypothetical protein